MNKRKMCFSKCARFCGKIRKEKEKKSVLKFLSERNGSNSTRTKFLSVEIDPVSFRTNIFVCEEWPISLRQNLPKRPLGTNGACACLTQMVILANGLLIQTGLAPVWPKWSLRQNDLLIQTRLAPVWPKWSFRQTGKTSHCDVAGHTLVVTCLHRIYPGY